MHCTYGAGQSALRELERAQARGSGSEGDLSIGKLWKDHWDQVSTVFDFSAEVRRIIYTTNAVESLPMSLRKIIKTRGSFPSEEAALQLLYLALQNWFSACFHCCTRFHFALRFYRSSVQAEELSANAGAQSASGFAETWKSIRRAREKPARPSSRLLTKISARELHQGNAENNKTLLITRRV